MPSNPKYRSLDDILSALKDEDQVSEDQSAGEEDLPKKFPAEVTAKSSKRDSEKSEISEIDDEADIEVTQPSKSTKSEIAAIADELDDEDEADTKSKSSKPDTSNEEPETTDDDEEEKEEEIDENEVEIEDDDPVADIDEQRTTNNEQPTTSDAKPKSTWRTSPANMKNAEKTEKTERAEISEIDDDTEGSSLPESMRDERPNFDVPIPKPAAKERWADFPEYPTETDETADPPVYPDAIGAGGRDSDAPNERFESNLTDIVDSAARSDSSEPDGFPIRRIDHSVNNRFGTSRVASSAEAEDDSSFGGPRGRSFDYSLNQTSKNRKWQYLIIGLVALIVVAAIVFALKNQYIPFVGSPSNVVITSPSPSPSPTPSPTPTPEPELPRANFKIRVLNGTTTSGLAASVAEKLKTLGFQIGKVGNNSSQSVTQTIIRVKPGEASVAAQLVKDLTGQFEATLGAELKASDTDDAEVVIGAK